MKISSRLVLNGAVAAAITLGGCSALRKDAAPDNKPTSAEDALARLSPQHKQAFDGWQQQVVKSCDPGQAFGMSKGNKLETDGVDGAALIKQNGGSLVFSEGNELVVLNSYTSFSGIGSSKIDNSVQVNGKGYSISAETKREGSACTLYLYGHKVFEGYIAESFAVGPQWNPSKSAQASSLVPTIQPVGTGGSSVVGPTGISDLSFEILRPTQDAVALLARKLGLDKATAGKLFSTRGFRFQSATRLADEPSAAWTTSGELVAARDVLAGYFDGGSRSVPLELRVAIPELKFAGVANDKDRGTLKLDLEVQVARKDNTFTYVVQSVQYDGVLAHDRDEALTCARARVAAYVGVAARNNRLDPSVEATFGPCRVLDPGVEKASYESGLMRELVPVLFADVTPSRAFRYEGWDAVLSKLMLKTLAQRKSVREELDPDSRTTIVPLLALHLESVESEIERSRNLSTISESIYRMGLAWALRGENPSRSRATHVLEAADNALVPFRASTLRLLADVSADPEGQQDAIDYASRLNDQTKRAASQSLALATELGYTDFEREVFNQALQKRIATAEWTEWSTRLGTIKSRIGKYPQLAELRGELVAHSVRWLKSGEVGAAQLDSVYAALDNAIVPFAASTATLVQALSRPMAENAQALDFARSLTADYKKQAVSARDAALAVGSKSWAADFFDTILQKRPTLEQVRVWNKTWTAAVAFSEREQNRAADGSSPFSERNRTQVIERAASEGWTAEHFTALESIAWLAQDKTSCERYKDASSLADCAGLRLFSTTKGQFFDPRFGNRYGALAEAFGNHLDQLSDDDGSSLRRNLVNEFFGSFEPVWSKCETSAFKRKSAALASQIKAVAKETDTFKRWDIERQITETLRDCD